MPELPEVETIARGLQKSLSNRCIIGVETLRPETFTAGREHLDALPGSRFTAVHRRGKLLLVELDCGPVMAVHLKMTGRLFLPETDFTPDKHTHVLFHLEPAPDRRNLLVYHDVRKFGYIRLLTRQELEAWAFFAGLGPEPLETTAAALAECCRRRTARIKCLLLDQCVVAGVGNIYADESLFRAGIRPNTPAHRISRKRLTTLFLRLQEVLQEAIDACGSSISNYRDAKGNAGAFQNKFRVYGKCGLPCPACGKTLCTTKVAGRTSTYCPGCQR